MRWCPGQHRRPDHSDPGTAFDNPTKFVGPIYAEDEAQKNWQPGGVGRSALRWLQLEAGGAPPEHTRNS